ncbi:hypothetical protein [Novosphingobium terrae]|uniref:hypothetical protein n=1 Tax=Novosphingobium terrae TaxID=2726189 RepID=UPI00197F9E80|nr:hypothetical protein [Novosphingobium terrae]
MDIQEQLDALNDIATDLDRGVSMSRQSELAAWLHEIIGELRAQGGLDRPNHLAGGGG